MKKALALIALLAFGASARAQVIPPGTNPVPAGCAFNTTPPTIPSGQAAWVQCDSAGRMIVTTVPSAGNATSTPASFTTSATPGTATTPIAANALRKVIKFRVEGAGIVCFSKYTTTPVCGATGTFSLAAASSAGNGTGGSYVTPAGFTDQEAWSVVSSTASVVVFADWQ